MHLAEIQYVGQWTCNNTQLDAPEYTSSESGYVSAHMREVNDEVGN